MEKIKVFLAEDHKIVREGLKALLTTAENITICGETDTGTLIHEKIRNLKPDIVLMDLQMPGLNGIDASQQLKKEFPRIKIIILSMYGESEYVSSALSAGVDGYILKGEGISEIIEAINLVHADKYFFSPQILKAVKDYNEKPSSGNYNSLTKREKEILKLIADGKTSFEIGIILSISPKTVEVHRLNLMSKLDIHNIAGLVKYASTFFSE